MRRLLREPLIHFILLGALLFLLYNTLNKGLQAPDEIVISSAEVTAIRDQFNKTWQRQPTAQEMKGLIDAAIREEVLFREGLAVGVDQGDKVIRRRVIQKVEFLSDGAMEQVPTEADLQAWLDANQERYRTQPRYTFEQLYFDPSRHGATLASDVDRAKAALLAGKPATGDSTMLPASLDNQPASEVVRIFGDQFAEALPTIKQGGWSEPVRSGFGIHLVRINTLVPGRVAKLDEVRQAVERDLTNDRTEKNRETFYRKLLEGYTVTVEPAAPDAVGSKAAAQ